MKKTSLSLIAISVLSLTSCNPFVWEKNNAFYTDKILNQYHLAGLPAVEYDYSYITKKNKKLTGYFYTDEEELDRHGEAIFDYFKNSDIKYGLLIDNSYMFGMPNIFDLLKTRSLLPYATHLDFYKIYGDRYAFFYEVEDQKYEILIKKDHNEIKDKQYNYLLEIGKVSNLRWAPQYKEVVITNDNYQDYIKIDISYNKDDMRYAGMGMEFIPTSYAFLDVTVKVDFLECGEVGSYEFVLSANHNQTSILFTRDNNEKYQEGDIQITGVSISKESAYIYNKSESKTTNNEQTSEPEEQSSYDNQESE